MSYSATVGSTSTIDDANGIFIDAVLFPVDVTVSDLIEDDVSLSYDRRIKLDNKVSLTFASFDVIAKMFDSTAKSWADVFDVDVMREIKETPRYIISVLLSYYSIGVHVMLSYPLRKPPAQNQDEHALEKIYSRLARGLISVRKEDMILEIELEDIKRRLQRFSSNKYRDLYSLCAITFMQYVHKIKMGKK